MPRLTCMVTAETALGESLEVEFTCQGMWHTTLESILRLVDNRTSQQNGKVIEDGDYYSGLGPERYAQLMDVVHVQFPTHATVSLHEPDVRVLVRKQTGHHEYIAVRADCEAGDDIRAVVMDLFIRLDHRLEETNRRDMKAVELYKSYPPADQIPVQMVLDVLYGRAQADHVAQRLQAAKEVDGAG